MTIQISAIVCSHNGEDFIAKTLDSLANQSLEKDRYEVIVVDNASTDSTRQIVQSKINETPNLRYEFEQTLGLSHARNKGWKAANGKFVAFIDDDAVADSSWLANIVGAFDNHEEAGVVGGKVTPIWSIEPPSWIKDDLMNALSLLDWSGECCFLEPGKWVCGVNVAYQKDLLEKHGGFCVQLGRKGSKLISNEEVFLNKGIVDDGYGILYSPDILVQHFIPEERLKKEWFFSRFYWQGRSDAVMDSKRLGCTKTYRSLVIKNIKNMLSLNIIKIWVSELELYNKVLVWRRIGYLVGAIPILARSFLLGSRD